MIEIENKKVKQLVKYYETIWALGSSLSLMGWDNETYMPENASNDRGNANSKLSLLIQKHMTSKSFLRKIEDASKENLNDTESAVVRVLKRSAKNYSCLPKRFIEEESKLLSKSQVVWRNAKVSNNFKEFEPYLEKVVNLNIRKAEFLDKSKSPYDVLLDLYEEGLTQVDVNRMFGEIKNPLSNLIMQISSKNPKLSDLTNEKYDKESMIRLNNKVLDLLGFDRLRQRMDVSSHPFSQTVSKNDQRITTRYKDNNFKESILATIHEFGHSSYEREIDSNLNYTPLDAGVSLGIHESQSRFWENQVARSRAFCNVNHNLLKSELSFLSKYNSEDVYRYFNEVKPGFIRVEADELTYNMHIILRYEIERDLINQKISVKEIPQVWNEGIDRLLGIKVPSDSLGCLQDIHWSMGSIGYFPTYSIGTLFGAQIKHNFEKEFGSLEEYINNSKYGEIASYLKEKIHKYGSIYKPNDLVRKSFNQDISSSYFLDYAKKKYSQIYDL